MKTSTQLTKQTNISSKINAINDRLKQIKTSTQINYKTNGEIKWEKIVAENINIFRCTDISLLISINAFLTVEFSSYENSAKELRLETYPAFTWLGFPIESWKNDISVRISQIMASEKILKLEKLKTTLESYMSNDDRLSILLKDLESLGL